MLTGMNLVLLAFAGACLVLFLLRRRSRLRDEDAVE
jgi:hypothetical protein